MPYKSKSKSKSKSKKNSKMTWRKAAGKALSLTSKAGINYLKYQLGLNTERFYKDTISTPANITTTLSNLEYALLIPQGNTAGSRTGQQLRLTSYVSHITLIPDPSSTDSGMIRVLFIRQKVVNNTIFTTSESYN